MFRAKARLDVVYHFLIQRLCAVAAEQWRSASQAVENFARLEKEWQVLLDSVSSSNESPRTQTNLVRLRRSPWTMCHAFFADMGGVHLKCLDFPAFPVNSHQLGNLIEHDHIEYPDIDAKAIWDKNRADTFARILTHLQWFLIQAIGRWVQHLAPLTFELSCLAFISCYINTFSMNLLSMAWHVLTLLSRDPLL